jgi:hypothetical protein
MPPALRRLGRIFNNPILSAISNIYFLVTFPWVSAVVSAVAGFVLEAPPLVYVAIGLAISALAGTFLRYLRGPGVVGRAVESEPAPSPSAVKPATVGSEMAGDHITSYNQSGGITAHTVHVAETPPAINVASKLGDNVKEGDRYVTSFALDLAGRPPALGFAARGEGVEEVRLRQDGPSTFLSNVLRGETTLGYHFMQCGNPAPGRYVAEVVTSAPVSKLDIHPLDAPIPSA